MSARGWISGFRAPGRPLRYEGVGKEIVHALKYGGYTRVVERLMAPLMVEEIEGSFDAVTCVPLHRSRRRKRGFNQAELMARGRRGEDKGPFFR